jgi:Protein of unknown function (DUF3455)
MEFGMKTHKIYLCSAAVLALAACSTPKPASGPQASVPAALQTPATEKAAFTWRATGTQNYECKADGKGGWAWTFIAPEAELFNDKNDKVGTHGAGPFWAALDGSTVTGAVKARSPAPSPSDIPWLLLGTTSAGKPGKMHAVTHVQRVRTVGGVAPEAGCTAAAAGQVLKRPYTSDYVFFTAV